MGIQIGRMIFDDWINLNLFNHWHDIFIFRLDTTAGLPPGAYAEIVRGLAASLRIQRRTGGIWVQVRNPIQGNYDNLEGNADLDRPAQSGREVQISPAAARWYQAELMYAVRKARLPVAVTLQGDWPNIWDFNYFPVGRERLYPRPPACGPYLLDGDIQPTELTCLRVLARTDCATTSEVASLAGYSPNQSRRALRKLAERGLVEPITTGRYPLWKICRPGVSKALRSWGHPPGRSFRRRKERGRDACQERVKEGNRMDSSEGKSRREFYRGGKKIVFLARDRSGMSQKTRGPRFSRHRRTARLWPAWLRHAWPLAKIWAGWTEVTCGQGRPDALCWGSLAGKETLFWLEVESGHDSRRNIQRKMVYRVNRALMYARRAPVRVVFTLLAPLWVREAAVRVVRELPPDLMVVLQDWKAFGELPLPGWGRVGWGR